MTKLLQLSTISFLILMMSTMVYSERLAPKPVKPLVYKGVKYEAIKWGKRRDLGQNGGHIEAFNAKTGKSLWILKIYNVYYPHGLEEDVSDTFITSMKIKNGYLIVTNEKKAVYKVNLKTRKVTKIK